MAGVVDGDAKWVAGTDILVQTGDIVDRGTYASDIYRLMQSLRSQASGADGKVVSILGNHEIMNAIGDWRYVTEGDIKHFGSVKARQEALSVDGWLGQEWLAKCVIRIWVSIMLTTAIRRPPLCPSRRTRGLQDCPSRTARCGLPLRTSYLTQTQSTSWATRC